MWRRLLSVLLMLRGPLRRLHLQLLLLHKWSMIVVTEFRVDVLIIAFKLILHNVRSIYLLLVLAIAAFDIGA